MQLEGSDAAAHLKAVDRSLAIREPLVFTRFSDGELFMLIGKEIRMTPNGAWIDGIQVNRQRYLEHDCKIFKPERDQDIVRELSEAYKYEGGSQYIVGLPYKCCVGEGLFDQLKKTLGLPTVHTTANLIINANYHAFLNRTLRILMTRDILLVANKRANTTFFGDALKAHVRLGDDCGKNLNKYYSMMCSQIEEVGSEDLVILSSASYISNIFGRRVAERWPEVSFLDIGTALHPQMGLGLIRGYLVEYWKNPEGYVGHDCECVG